MVAIWIPAIGKADASWVTGTISHMSYRGKIYCVVPEKRNREYCVCRVSDKEGEFKSSYYIVEKRKGVCALLARRQLGRGSGGRGRGRRGHPLCVVIPRRGGHGRGGRGDRWRYGDAPWGSPSLAEVAEPEAVPAVAPEEEADAHMAEPEADEEFDEEAGDEAGEEADEEAGDEADEATAK